MAVSMSPGQPRAQGQSAMWGYRPSPPSRPCQDRRPPAGHGALLCSQPEGARRVRTVAHGPGSLVTDRCVNSWSWCVCSVEGEPCAEACPHAVPTAWSEFSLSLSVPQAARALPQTRSLQGYQCNSGHNICFIG